MTILLIAAGVILLGFVIASLAGGGQNETGRINKMIDDGRLVEAKNILKARISRNDQSAVWHVLLGRVYETENNFEHAVVENRIILKNSAFTATIRREDVIGRIAENFFRLGQVDDALRVLGEERKRKESLWLLGLISRAFNLKGDVAAALTAAESALAIQPNSVPALAEKGEALRKQGRLTEAVETLDMATRTDRRNFRAWFYLASAFKDRREFEKAVQAFENAKFDRDLRPKALFEMASCYKARDMHKNAIEQYEKLIAEWDDSAFFRKTNPLALIAEARYQLAETSLADRDYQSAIDQWEIIQSFQADYKDVQAKLQANRRFGKDRVQDLLIASAGEFEKIAYHGVELMGFQILQRKLMNSDRMSFTVQSAKPRPRKLLLWFLRMQAPVGETVLAEFERSMKEQGLTNGVVVSPTGFSPTGIKFTFDKPFELYGRSHVMRALKSYENRFHEGPEKSKTG